MPPPKDSPAHDNESYSQLLSLAVHELRTPAGVVSGYLRMLQREVDHPLTDRQRKMIDEAEKSCARMIALIAELGEISKFDAGLLPLNQEKLDLFALIHEVAGTMPEAGDREVRLEVRGETAGAWMIGDRLRLRAAFAAILRSVLREQPAGDTVVVDCRLERRRGARFAKMAIAEDGGVQAAYGARSTSFDEKRGGIGLALPIARRVIEAHGGRLWSPENSKGRGAALVSLPLTALSR